MARHEGCEARAVDARQPPGSFRVAANGAAPGAWAAADFRAVEGVLAEEERPVTGDLRRWWRHLKTGPWEVRRCFRAGDLTRIHQAIAQSEQHHSGEIRFAVEATLDLGELVRGLSARDRALQVFSEHRLWDTEHNNGVLIYLLWADRAVEIVADRGARQRIDPQVWQEACELLRAALRQREGPRGVIEAVSRIGAALAQVDPVGVRDNPNELPNAPIVLR